MNASLIYKSTPIKIRSKDEYLPATITIINISEHDFHCHANHYLSKEEFRLYEDIKSNERKQSFVYGRVAAKIALKIILQDLKFEEVSIVPGLLGQPVIKNLSMNDYAISISHSKKIAAAIIVSSICPVGIDVEEISFSHINELNSICREYELELTANCHGDDEVTAKTRIWTLKEALSKALTCGFVVPLSYFDIIEFSRDQLGSCSFANFPQFIGHSYVLSDHVLSIVLPYNVKIEDNVIGSYLLHPG